MTDPQTGSKLIIVHRPDGTERHLKRLSPADWLRLGNTLRQTRKARRRSEMDAEFAAQQAAAPEVPVIEATPHPKAPSPGLPPVPGAPKPLAVKTAAEKHADAVRAEMKAIDNWKIRYLDVEDFVNTLEGQYAAILVSLGKDHPPETTAAALADELETLGLHPSEWTGVTADLLKLKRVADPLPSGPAAGEKSNQTGGASPTESAQPFTPTTTQ